MTRSQLHTRLLFNDNADDIWLCADVDFDCMYMERNRVGVGRTGSTLIFAHVWNEMLCHCLVYDATWHHCNCVLREYTTMKMIYGSALISMLLAYIERCHVGFNRTGSTLILAHIRIWICHCIVHGALWHHRNYALACYSNTLQWQWHIWHCVDIDWMYGTVSCWLWLHRKYVGIGSCLNVSLLGIWCTMKPSQLRNFLLFNCNGDGVRLCADVDWMYATVSCRLWLNRKYVVIGACVNLNVQLPGIRYTMQHESTIIALSPVIQTHYNGTVLMLIEYIMGRYRVRFGRTGSTLVSVYVWI